jgi:hypothetical protein
MPSRYGEYQLYGMVNTTPYDARFRALENLITSGALHHMDVDSARRIVTALMST